MVKKILHSISCVSILASAFVSAEENKSPPKSERRYENVHDDSYIDFFFNIKASHERKNEHFLGPKNCSAGAFNPLFTIGDVTLDADFYHGRQFKNTGYLKGRRNLSRITAYGNLAAFSEYFADEDSGLKESLHKGLLSNIDKAHFYRNYSRLVYNNKVSNFRAVLGDTKLRNTIGFQQPMSGAGISIFRQSGNGESISAGAPIVITRLSKIECKLGDEVLGYYILPPGIYTIDDLPEETKMAGVKLKISDQIGRKETINVNYFGSYSLLEQGKDDFDLALVYGHKWNIDDPHRMRYRNSPRFHSNYRYGYTDNITFGGGLQYGKKAYILDFLTIVGTDYGKFAPNISFSDARLNIEDYDRKSRKAYGAGFFYSTPENKCGISIETFFGIKSKGFSDLGLSMESQNEYNKHMEKYILDNNDMKNKLLNKFSEESTKQLVARLYSKPIYGITPSFIFHGMWSKSEKLKEYTLSFSTVIAKCTVTVSGGLSYDEPSKGINGKSPDKRFLIACSIPLHKELDVGTTFYRHDEDKNVYSLSATYRPEAIKGLELCAEKYQGPGSDNPSLSAEYDGDYFNLKVEEDINNSHRPNKTHDNQQRFYFATSFSPKGFGKPGSVGFNILKNAKDENKPKVEEEEDKNKYIFN